MAIPVNARTPMIAMLGWCLGSCAFSSYGVIHGEGVGAVLQAPDGQNYRLLTVGEAAPMAHLDGHLAHVDGRRVFRTVTVEDWSVSEGLHGMTAWVGELRWMGARLGMDDRNSGAFYTLEASASKTLGEHVGEVALVEGYVVGPNEVKVLYYRVLAD